MNDLRRLVHVLQEARRRRAPPEEVRKQVEHEFPNTGATLAKLLIPKDASGFYALVAVVIAVIMAISAKLSTPVTISQVFNQVYQLPPTQSAPPAPSRTPVRKAKKPGRKDPCSCGSGNKFKICCGAG